MLNYCLIAFSWLLMSFSNTIPPLRFWTLGQIQGSEGESKLCVYVLSWFTIRSCTLKHHFMTLDLVKMNFLRCVKRPCFKVFLVQANNLEASNTCQPGDMLALLMHTRILRGWVFTCSFGRHFCCSCVNFTCVNKHAYTHCVAHFVVNSLAYIMCV